MVKKKNIYFEKHSKYVVYYDKALLPTIMYQKRTIGNETLISFEFRFWHYFFAIKIFV